MSFFKPVYFLPSFTSQKIGYWRYITIYRHLETHQKTGFIRFSTFFENWCQDENRHGDFFDAVMKEHLIFE
jgi:magnesium-protoporphyrin IX monomethyl ester (oxidative) cyclase